MRVVIVGGGWAGCAAAVAAKKNGAEVLLIERSDLLLGTGLVGGIMRNNGRYTATEEMIALGGGDLFKIIDNHYICKDIALPGHENASIYDTTKIEPIIRNYLLGLNIEIEFQCRFTDVNTTLGKINLIKCKTKDGDKDIVGDVFVDATGSCGPMINCRKYGNGCAMCIMRCPSFGSRVSLSEKAAGSEILLSNKGFIGGISGSCKIMKESLSEELQSDLKKNGIAIIPIPEAIRSNLKIADLLKSKACQQYATKDFKNNIILINTGMAKMMLPYFPLSELRKIRGFEYSRYEDPYSGSIGNSIRYVSAPLHDKTLKVDKVENLFCAGEKVGACVGHTEAICTGTLAGYNAVQFYKSKNALILPNKLAVGDYISYSTEGLLNNESAGVKCTFAGSVYFQRMKDKVLYLKNKKEIKNKVESLGMTNVFERKSNI